MNEKIKKNRENLTNYFIASLENDPLNWKKNWIAPARPQNGVTKNNYRGLNAIYLQMFIHEHSFHDPRFFTFKQAIELGYKVKKGSHGMPIEFWSYYDKDKKETISIQEATLRIRMNPSLEEKKIIFPVGRTYIVFNGEQIDGIEPYKEKKVSNAKVSETIQCIAKEMNVSVLHDGKGRAFYRPSTDSIHLPEPSAFFSQDAYNATLLHEIGHATGAKHRLNRNIENNSFGSNKYAKEELVAEITSCFSMTDLGLREVDDDVHKRNHVAYVQSWIKELKDKPSVLIDAIKKASSASDYILQNHHNLFKEHSVVPEKNRIQTSLNFTNNYKRTNEKHI